MVAGFHRSFSLPGSPCPKTRPASEKSYHVRSVSLPCRSHPLVSQLEDEIRSVKSWQQHSTQPQPESASASSSSRICEGLARLELLHASLTDLLHLPQNQDSLRRASGSGSGSAWTDRVLDDFLRFADAHGSFRAEMVAMSELQSEAQVAIRRKDAVNLSSCVRSMKKTEKELVKLASSLREISKSPMATRLTSIGSIEEAELAGIIREAINVTVTASASVFLEVAAVLSATSAAVAALTAVKNPLRLSMSKSLKMNVGEEGEDCRRKAMERLEAGEECIGAVEGRSERLFRCLLSTRVSLLNILTP